MILDQHREVQRVKFAKLDVHQAGVTDALLWNQDQESFDVLGFD